MPRESAGVLLYRCTSNSHPGSDQYEVLLVHPSGNYNRRAPWGIPKGVPEPGEALEAAARRETEEETGVTVTGELSSLGFCDYTKSRKRVHAFAALAPPETAPRCASWEVDRAEFVPFPRARELIHVDQLVFLERLARLLRIDSPADDGEP
jgi:predicted NUDIX family NTP pyrophosphohydrolase